MSKALPKGSEALCYVKGYERPALRRVMPQHEGGLMIKRSVPTILLAIVLYGCGRGNDTGGGAVNDVALNEALYANLDMPGDEVASTPPLSPKLLVSVCKAAIASSFGRSASIMKVVSKTGDIVRVRYNRPDDGKQWTNDCRVEGNRIIWRTVDAFPGDGPGIWRTRPDDDVLTFEVKGNEIAISTVYAGTSGANVETFPAL
jgi:hypothetical protein